MQPSTYTTLFFLTPFDRRVFVFFYFCFPRHRMWSKDSRKFSIFLRLLLLFSLFLLPFLLAFSCIVTAREIGRAVWNKFANVRLLGRRTSVWWNKVLVWATRRYANIPTAHSVSLAIPLGPWRSFETLWTRQHFYFVFHFSLSSSILSHSLCIPYRRQSRAASEIHISSTRSESLPPLNDSSQFYCQTSETRKTNFYQNLMKKKKN